MHRLRFNLWVWKSWIGVWKWVSKRWILRIFTSWRASIEVRNNYGRGSNKLPPLQDNNHASLEMWKVRFCCYSVSDLESVVLYTASTSLEAITVFTIFSALLPCFVFKLLVQADVIILFRSTRWKMKMQAEFTLFTYIRVHLCRFWKYALRAKSHQSNTAWLLNLCVCNIKVTIYFSHRTRPYLSSS